MICYVWLPRVSVKCNRKPVWNFAIILCVAIAEMRTCNYKTVGAVPLWGPLTSLQSMCTFSFCYFWCRSASNLPNIIWISPDKANETKYFCKIRYFKISSWNTRTSPGHTDLFGQLEGPFVELFWGYFSEMFKYLNVISTLSLLIMSSKPYLDLQMI